MSSEVVDAEFRPLAVREEQAASPALFGTDEPTEIVTQAVRVANALKAVITSKSLVSRIQGKEYVQVEGWQTLGSMLRLAPICEWSRKTPEGDGWEARVVVRDRMGNVVGAAEAQCTRDERSWKSRDEYALRSMAQTRATSKALRSVVGFVMVLAGFQGTPKEEMPRDTELEEEPPAPAVRYMTKEQAKEIRELNVALALEEDYKKALLEKHCRGRLAGKDTAFEEAAALLEALRIESQPM